MNKYTLIILITVGIISIALFAYFRDSDNANREQLPAPVLSTAPSKISDVVAVPAGSQTVITYTDSGFSPNPLRIKAGTVVTYINKSSHKMWPASALHPTHREYPTTGGCLGSTFDACKGIEPGASWGFKFDFIGSWNYHNHLTPTDYGKIIVE